MKNSSEFDKMYQPPKTSIWRGRQTDPRFGAQYWYQNIEPINLNNSLLQLEQRKKKFALLGYACDEGVRRNQGRVGAVNGPDAIRKSLAKIALHFENTIIFDVGDVYCIDQKMEACQKQFAQIIEQLMHHNIFPIGLGGGHDIAYANFMGLQAAKQQKKIGIINFDAHFDLRPVEQQSNSGTPFYQINEHLKNINQELYYFIIGIQKQSNTKQLFKIADEIGTHYIYHDKCNGSQLDSIQLSLDRFINQVDHLYMTIDLDGFSSAYVSGVSAPSPIGFTPNFFFQVLQHVLDSNKVIGCDIAELNPTFDKDNQTSNLAAKIVDFIVFHNV